MGSVWFDITLKARVNPFPSGSGSGFRLFPLPREEFLPRQYDGQGGVHTRRRSPISRFFWYQSSFPWYFYCFLGVMSTVGLTQSRRDTYTGWYNIVGKISTTGFFWFFLHHFYFSCNSSSDYISCAKDESILSKFSNNNNPKNPTTSLILPFSNINHRLTRDDSSASARATGDCSANGTVHW